MWANIIQYEDFIFFARKGKEMEEEMRSQGNGAQSLLSHFGDDVRYFTPGGLLTTPFVIGQTIFNVVASFSIVLFFFWIIFVEMGEPYYACSSSEALSPYIISPFACSILALAWAPVSMIDAVERQWFGPVRRYDLTGGFILNFSVFIFL